MSSEQTTNTYKIICDKQWRSNISEQNGRHYKLFIKQSDVLKKEGVIIRWFSYKWISKETLIVHVNLLFE